MGQPDVELFAAVARTTEWRMGELKPQELANMVWAFATVGEPAPALLNPISVLDLMEAQGFNP